MPSKSSPLDVLPCSQLKGCADVFTPIITRLVNLSFQTGNFPSSYKKSTKSAAAKESRARHAITGKLQTDQQLVDCLQGAQKARFGTSSTPSRLHQLQSIPVGLQKGHCTQTALLEVLDSVYTAADDKQVIVLIGLNLSAAFDMVSHDTLLHRFTREFGVTRMALFWIQSYPSDKSQFVKLGHQSVTSRVPRRRRPSRISIGTCCSPSTVIL